MLNESVKLTIFLYVSMHASRKGGGMSSSTATIFGRHAGCADIFDTQGARVTSAVCCRCNFGDRKCNHTFLCYITCQRLLGRQHALQVIFRGSHCNRNITGTFPKSQTHCNASMVGLSKVSSTRAICTVPTGTRSNIWQCMGECSVLHGNNSHCS